MDGATTLPTDASPPSAEEFEPDGVIEAVEAALRCALGAGVPFTTARDLRVVFDDAGNASVSVDGAAYSATAEEIAAALADDRDSMPPSPPVE